MEEQTIQLLLGCFGYQEEGFVSCKGCENCILVIEPALEGYSEILDYLDHCRLFDKALFEYNSINAFIKRMSQFDQVAKNRRLWSEKQCRMFNKFLVDHRICGIYAKLSLINNNKTELSKIEEKAIDIKSLENLPKISGTKIKFGIRGKRGL